MGFGKDHSIEQDIALVRACLAGDGRAWESLVALYRGKVYAAALSMTHDPSAAAELADSLWAELYGIRKDADGGPVSKLNAYSGIGSLEGWLRALIAQACVDRYRQNRRFVPLDNQVLSAASPESPVTDARVDAALDDALAELAPEQRLLLASYYLDNRRGEEIGRMLGVHESTVSRRLRKAELLVRKRTLHHLRRRGLTIKEANAVLAGRTDQVTLDIRDRLLLVKDLL